MSTSTTHNKKAELKMPKPKGPSLFALLKNYKSMVLWLILLGILANILTLYLPRLSAHAIDAYIRRSLDVQTLATEFGLISFGIFFFTYVQTIIQTYASEK